MTGAEPAAPAAAEPAATEPAAAEPVAEPVPTAAVAPAPLTITVQPGYTLWGIAKANMGQGIMYVQVYKANRDKIRDPDLIYPGQVFMMPVAD